ncbi:MAG: NAD-dependent protein deacetylase [Pseudomonadota bacterium]
MSDIARILELWPEQAQFAVLTGAGCSTGAGIPDYRDEKGEWKHARPVMYADFMAKLAVRQRYWSRSMLGWPRMAKAQPTECHTALADMQARGHLTGIITQNVDRLHQRSGSEAIDLHGALDEVRCQNCGAQWPRSEWQQRIREANPNWQATVVDIQDAPDGDAILEGADYASFSVPDCELCGGIVKPEVVFFGENVPKSRVAAAYDMVDQAHGLLVVGSSLMVFSGLRFVRRAAQADKPVVIINRGVTRGDDVANLKIESEVSDTLSALARALRDRANVYIDTQEPPSDR